MVMGRGQSSEHDPEQVRAGRERRLALANDIRNLEAVRERLLAVDEISRTYPEGHHVRTRLENLHLESVIQELDEQLRELYDRTAYPRGT